ncbi:restriction endonuclease [Denitratimonas sp. CY0512]|uniref:restriction endonuclease n=1 Tax=Denitratimonas sp. CY0512 TaxID=3131940 RepID=UPI00309E0240
MGRRKKNGFFEELTTLPWPVGVAAGLIAFLLIRYALPALLGGSGNTYLQAFSTASNTFAPLAWLVLIACSLASLMSFIRARQDRQLLDTRTGLDSLAALGWKEFERLVGEAFRREGHVVEATGLGGADGGIDLILYRDGRRTLVQCKQWRRRSIPVSVVREMYGLLAHHQADEVRIVASGKFTRDAAQFAEDKPIALIDGTQLLTMIRAVQSSSNSQTAKPTNHQYRDAVTDSPDIPEPNCPRCNAGMTSRRNSKTGQPFWGCSSFPRCKGTRPAG